MKMKIEKYAVEKKTEEKKPIKRRVLGAIKIAVPAKEEKTVEQKSGTSKEMSAQLHKPEFAHRPKKKKSLFVSTKAKRKTAIARANLSPGSGNIRINKHYLETLENNYLKNIISEPLNLAGEEIFKKYDISVNVFGGGFMGQALAARGAIAKAIVSAEENEDLKKKFIAYDRSLLIDDTRRKEAKKQLGLGARKKKQKSKR